MSDKLTDWQKKQKKTQRARNEQPAWSNTKKRDEKQKKEKLANELTNWEEGRQRHNQRDTPLNWLTDNMTDMETKKKTRRTETNTKGSQTEMTGWQEQREITKKERHVVELKDWQGYKQWDEERGTRRWIKQWDEKGDKSRWTNLQKYKKADSRDTMGRLVRRQEEKWKKKGPQTDWEWNEERERERDSQTERKTNKNTQREIQKKRHTDGLTVCQEQRPRRTNTGAAYSNWMSSLYSKFNECGH